MCECTGEKIEAEEVKHLPPTSLTAHPAGIPESFCPDLQEAPDARSGQL
jgi:hypothetical protein